MGKEVALDAQSTKKEKTKKEPEGATSPKTRPVQVVAIFPELREAILNYLQTRPLGEVANLYQALQQSQTIVVNQTIEGETK